MCREEAFSSRTTSHTFRLIQRIQLLFGLDEAPGHPAFADAHYHRLEMWEKLIYEYIAEECAK